MRLTIFIPTLNQKNLLLSNLLPLVKQMDLFDRVVIMDNGKQNINILTNKFIVITNESNLGVAGSWNQAITKYKTESDWILFLNDDIALNSVQLYEINDVLKNNMDKFLLCGPYYLSVFALNMNFVDKFNIETQDTEKYQIFDENFYPAYFEDNDLIYRIYLKDPKLMRFNIGCFCPAVCNNSMTLIADPSINSRFGLNKQFYITKWGGVPGNEKFTKPFNNS